jgi:hypothetical protein
MNANFSLTIQSCGVVSHLQLSNALTASAKRKRVVVVADLTHKKLETIYNVGRRRGKPT